MAGLPSFGGLPSEGEWNLTVFVGIAVPGLSCHPSNLAGAVAAQAFLSAEVLHLDLSYNDKFKPNLRGLRLIPIFKDDEVADVIP